MCFSWRVSLHNSTQLTLAEGVTIYSAMKPRYIPMLSIPGRLCCKSLPDVTMDCTADTAARPGHQQKGLEANACRGRVHGRPFLHWPPVFWGLRDEVNCVGLRLPTL